MKEKRNVKVEQGLKGIFSFKDMKVGKDWIPQKNTKILPKKIKETK